MLIACYTVTATWPAGPDTTVDTATEDDAADQAAAWMLAGATTVLCTTVDGATTVFGLDGATYRALFDALAETA